MSGDEDYEDFFDEDYLWLDAGDPHVADEMAMMTSPDPVYLDERALYAAFDSDTDPEDFMDDYYDDDPSLKLQVRRRREKAAARVMKQTEEKKKGNLLDRAMFCGVSWRVGPRVDAKGPIYNPGDGEEVALLKNWREVFKQSKPKMRKLNEGLKPEGKIVATFRCKLSARPRPEHATDAPISQDGDAAIDTLPEGVVGKTDTTSHTLDHIESTSSEYILPPPSELPGSINSIDNKEKPAKRGRGRPRVLRGNSSRLKEEVKYPVEEEKLAPNFRIVAPPAPVNSTEYVEMHAPNIAKRGRKRKADSTAVNVTPGRAETPDPDCATKTSKRKRVAAANGVSSSRPTRSTAKVNSYSK